MKNFLKLKPQNMECRKLHLFKFFMKNFLFQIQLNWVELRVLQLGIRAQKVGNGLGVTPMMVMICLHNFDLHLSNRRPVPTMLDFLCSNRKWAYWLVYEGNLKYSNRCTVGSKIIRALEIVRVKKLIPNAVLWNKYL